MSNPKVDILIKAFEGWEYLSKARKAKGLDQWKKLLPISDKLSGKKSNHISYTCMHPSHEVPKLHHLGSNEGNLHFLMGYGNPGFHLAPYHMQIIDPNLSEADAEKQAKGHPSNPDFWKDSEIYIEGDKLEGAPHPKVKDKVRSIRREKLDKYTVSQSTGTYTAVPVEGIVYEDGSEVQYSWALVKDSYFSAQDEKMSDAMNLVEEIQEAQKSLEATFNVGVPDLVAHLAKASAHRDFVEGIYPLVKSKFPSPGSVVPLSAKNEETIYGVVTHKSIDFYDRECNEVSVRAYDRWYPSFSLEKGGNVHPSVLLNFICGHLGIMREDISVFTHRED